MAGRAHVDPPGMTDCDGDPYPRAKGTRGRREESEAFAGLVDLIQPAPAPAIDTGPEAANDDVRGGVESSRCEHPFAARPTPDDATTPGEFGAGSWGLLL